ncbi:hypothetical protein D3C83_155530 [compost metagenome]
MASILRQDTLNAAADAAIETAIASVIAADLTLATPRSEALKVLVRRAMRKNKRAVPA